MINKLPPIGVIAPRIGRDKIAKAYSENEKIHTNKNKPCTS